MDKPQELAQTPDRGEKHPRLEEENQKLRTQNPKRALCCSQFLPSLLPAVFPGDPILQPWAQLPPLRSSHLCQAATNPQGLTPAPHTFPGRYFSYIWPNWSQSLLQLGPAAARGCDSAAPDRDQPIHILPNLLLTNPRAFQKAPSPSNEGPLG